MGLWDRLERATTRSTAGCRLYAIGDIHGCFDLLVRLLQLIEIDHVGRVPMETHLILLGDYVDRGRQSREVCELLQAMESSSYFHCLRGNHEQTLLDVLDGSQMALRFWMKYGGEETLLSWGIDPDLIADAYISERSELRLIAALQTTMPARIQAWLRSLPAHYLHGDYLFVHAGIRPKLPLEEQAEDDLLWIREPFLSSRTRHPWLVVHGHSEHDRVDVATNRIGIDTGAYRTGVLTAIGIEGNEHWTVQADLNMA